MYMLQLKASKCGIFFYFFFSPKDPLRSNSPVAMDTSIETVDPLGVNAPMQQESENRPSYYSSCPYVNSRSGSNKTILLFRHGSVAFQ